MRKDMPKAVKSLRGKPSAPKRGAPPRGTKFAGDRPKAKAAPLKKLSPARHAKGSARPPARTLDSRALGEDSAPLRQFLTSHIGRAWEQVFNEINAPLKADRTLQEQVLSQVDALIHRRVQAVPPTRAFPCGLAATRGGRGARQPVAAGELYVDPRDGIIKLAKRRLFDRGSPGQASHRRINASEIAVKVDGTWLSVTVQPFRIAVADGPMFAHEGRPTEAVNDVVLGPVQAKDAARLRQRYGADVFGTAKRQLSPRELRNLALVND